MLESGKDIMIEYERMARERGIFDKSNSRLQEVAKLYDNFEKYMSFVLEDIYHSDSSLLISDFAKQFYADGHASEEFYLDNQSDSYKRKFFKSLVAGDFDSVIDKKRSGFLSDIKKGLYDTIIVDFVRLWPMSEEEVFQQDLAKAKRYLNGNTRIEFACEDSRKEYEQWACNIVKQADDDLDLSDQIDSL